MKTWATYGVFGDDVIELGFMDVIRLLCGGEVAIGSTVICLGKSKRSSLGQSISREAQLVERKE